MGPGFCTPWELIVRNDVLGIEKAVVLPIVSPEVYFPQAVEDILEMCAEYPDKLIPYCNIDPRWLTNSPRAPLGKIIRHYKERGCKGIGEVMPNLPLLDPLVQNLFACAEDEDMPIVYDGSAQLTGDFGLYDDPGLPQLEFTLQQFPKLKIFGHGPVFWNEIAKLETPGERSVYFGWRGEQIMELPKGKVKEEGVVPKLFRKYPNLHGDLSDGTAYNAFARDDEYGPAFMTEFQDRLFFGTDMCFPDMPVEIDKLLIAWREGGKISETVFQKIARENAVKLLGL
jgi:predicted TIM-barrel fold metal-dependent hydrolase